MASSPSTSIAASLEALCDWLTAEPRAARDVAAHLGSIESESASAVHVKPTDPAYAHAIVSHDGTRASYVALQLARAGLITVTELEHRFGAYVEPPMLHGPPAIHFAVDRGAARPLTCLVVAKGAASDADVASGQIRELGIRLDPRL